MNNLEDVITDAVNDSQIDETPDVTPEVTTEVEAAPEAVAETPTDAPEPETSETVEVASPAVPVAEEGPQDEFAKLAGVPQVGVAGRENRIPYSRVKKITEKAVSDLAEVALGRKLAVGEKPVDVVKAYVAKIPELESKVTDYETRLEHVGQFERVMENEPQKFLTMLARIPAYKDFFEFVDRAAAQDKAPATPPVAEVAPVVDSEAGMPEPDEELSDGSKIYSMDGIKQLLNWKASQTAALVTKQLEERYKPIENDWQERKRIEATLPVIRKQIEEAKTWHLFVEIEGEITKYLQDNPSATLESAYRSVVFPKLIAERNKTRQDVIKEIQTAPTSTAVPTRAATKPAPSTSTGPRNLEDIIKESIEPLKR